jgi:putative Ca2+/H+ antiporter (TMEM165/GDT1 family)
MSLSSITHRPLLLSSFLLLLLASTVSSQLHNNKHDLLRFDRYDPNGDHVIDRTEFDTLLVPKMAEGLGIDDANDDNNNAEFKMPAGHQLEQQLHPNGRIKGSHPSDTSHLFVPSFFSSLSLIIATEIGDKTFFIAAILSMRFDRLPVFLGAFAALAIMTGLSSAMGMLLPALGLSRSVTHTLGSLMFLYFGIKLLWDSRSMASGAVSDELAEVEEELISKKGDGLNDADATAVNGAGNGGGRKDVQDVRDDDDKTELLEEGNNESNSPSSSSTVASQPAWDKVITQSLTLTFLAEWGDRSQLATISLASSKDALGVTLGGTLGHGICTGMACLGGRMLASRISEKTASVGGGIIFLLFACHGLLFEDVS